MAVLRQFVGLESGDVVLDAWMADSLFSWLVEGTLSWLELGDARGDDQFVELVTEGLSGLRAAWG